MFTSTTALQSIEVGGRQLHYVEEGEGQPVIFVHGGIKDYRVWTPQIGPFARRYRVIAYSRRYAYPNKWVGDGTDSSISDNASDLAELINKLGLAPVNLVGHSYGAYVAIFCALHHPELVRTLVLAEPPILPLLVKNTQSPFGIISLFFKSPATTISLIRLYAKTIKPAQEAIQRGDCEGAVKVFESGVMGRESAFENFPALIRTIVLDNANSLKGEQESGFAPFGIEDARKVSAPSLLMKGELSPKFLRRITEILAKYLPSNELVTIEGASHDMTWVKPEEFNTKVLEFLARHT